MKKEFVRGYGRMTDVICAGLILLLVSATSDAQSIETMEYEAQFDESGEIELVPRNDESSSPTRKTEQLGKLHNLGEVFLVRNAEGAVKGIYAQPSAAFEQQFAPGDSVQVLAASREFVAGNFTQGATDIDQDMLDKVAREAAKRLLNTVRSAACDFDPLPETVSPSVEVSFSFLAGTSLSISATWKTEKVCAE